MLTKGHRTCGSKLTDPLSILVAASLGIQAIGAGYALANGTNPKHASKRVDRLFSNTKISLDAIALPWFDAVLDGLRDI